MPASTSKLIRQVIIIIIFNCDGEVVGLPAYLSKYTDRVAIAENIIILWSFTLNHYS